MSAELRERLAALCHEQWSGWMDYLFGKCITNLEPGCMILPRWAVDRWQRQAKTAYTNLSEEEKNSDRAEAERFIALLPAALTPGEPAPGLDLEAEVQRLRLDNMGLRATKTDAVTHWSNRAVAAEEEVERLRSLLEPAPRAGVDLEAIKTDLAEYLEDATEYMKKQKDGSLSQAHGRGEVTAIKRLQAILEGR